MNPRKYDRFFVIRLLPTFALFSTAGCLLGRLAFSVPLEELGVAVSVWMVCAFVVSRILILIVPRLQPQSKQPPLLYILLSVPPFLGLMLGPVFLCAGFVFRSLGLAGLSAQSLHVAFTLGGLVAVDAVAITLSTLIGHASIQNACRAVVNKTFQFFWELLSSPTKVSRATHLEHMRVHH